MSLESATLAALVGPERKNVKVMGHDFAVEPAVVTRSRRRTTADGRISHHPRLGPGDRIHYHVEKTGAVVREIHMHIDHGGLTTLVAPLAPVTALLGVPITPDMVEAVGQALGRLAESDWEPAAQAIVLGIAARL